MATAIATATATAAETATGMHDTRNAERRARDTAASGQDASAAEQYAALAAAYPDDVAFGEAARILRTPHRGSARLERARQRQAAAAPAGVRRQDR